MVFDQGPASHWLFPANEHMMGMPQQTDSQTAQDSSNSQPQLVELSRMLPSRPGRTWPPEGLPSQKVLRAAQHPHLHPSGFCLPSARLVPFVCNKSLLTASTASRKMALAAAWRHPRPLCAGSGAPRGGSGFRGEWWRPISAGSPGTSPVGVVRPSHCPAGLLPSLPLPALPAPSAAPFLCICLPPPPPQADLRPRVQPQRRGTSP